MNVINLSVKQLQQAAAIKGQIERLHTQLRNLLGNSASVKAGPKKRRKMSAAGRAAIAAAQKARWAKIKARKK